MVKHWPSASNPRNRTTQPHQTYFSTKRKRKNFAFLMQCLFKFVISLDSHNDSLLQHRLPLISFKKIECSPRKLAWQTTKFLFLCNSNSSYVHDDPAKKIELKPSVQTSNYPIYTFSRIVRRSKL